MLFRAKLKRAATLTGLLTLLLAGMSCGLLPGGVSAPSEAAPTSIPAATASAAIEAAPTDAPAAVEPTAAPSTLVVAVPATAEGAVAATEESQPDNTASSGSVQVEFENVSFSFAYNVAGSWTAVIVPEGPGMSASAGPSSATDPEHVVFTLDDYVLPSRDNMPPQIFVYPAPKLTEQNPGAADRISGLQAYLADPPANLLAQDQAIPFLPLYPAAQAFHTQVRFIDFQNGKGVRFLTQYAQSPFPASNATIFYTFQGLTTDGSYYIAAVMPVTHPSLPDTVQMDDYDAFMATYDAYLDDLTQQLDGEAPGTYTPDLAALDALFKSLQVKP